MSDKTITGVVTWLRNWFYTKSEVDSLVATGGTSISIEDTDLFDVLDCINNNFDNFDKFDGYLFYDACDSATTLSNYESSIPLRNSGSSAITQNGTKHQLTITKQGQSFIEIPALEGVTDSFKMIIHSKTSSNQNYCGIGLCLYIDANNWYSIEDTSEKIWTYKKVNGAFSYTQGSATTNYIGADLVQECIYDSQTHKIILNKYDSNMVFIQSKELSVPSTITNPHWGVATDWEKDVYVLLEKIEVESL